MYTIYLTIFLHDKSGSIQTEVYVDEADVAALALDLPVDAVDGDWLADVLAGFAEAAADWRGALSSPATAESSGADTAHCIDDAGRA